MSTKTATVIHWILNEGRFLPGPGPLITGLCTQLSEAGLGLMRSSAQIRPLHPEVMVVSYLWVRREVAASGFAAVHMVGNRLDPLAAGEVREISFAHGAFESETFRVSPFFPVVETGRTIRCALAADQTTFEYPILKDLHEVGATEYLALPIRFSQGPVSAASFVTDKIGGFTDDEVALLESIMPAFSMCLEAHSARHTTRSLLRTYLGADPGERVLAGQIKAGDVRHIDAAILFSDLRGFTTLSSDMDASELIATLNEYFSAVAEALEEHGGEILKFIGDALLVVFPQESPEDASAVCQQALDAAITANARLDLLNAQRTQAGKAPLRHGLGLHLGTAEYGNIGSSSRLDFTVIGRDVNLASRIEGMCGKLGRRLLASASFATQLPQVPWIDLGPHELKGLADAQSLLGIEEEEETE